MPIFLVSIFFAAVSFFSSNLYTMAVLSILVSPYLLLLIPLYVAVFYLIPYISSYPALGHIPGPWSAKFSNIWLGFSARKGQKFAAVNWAHRKYGKFVRVGYNHVSIADERALGVVYAHGNGFLKE